MKISKDERVDIRNMPVRMSKKVYKEMVKEMDKIASQEEPSQQAFKAAEFSFKELFSMMANLSSNVNFFKKSPLCHKSHNVNLLFSLCIQSICSSYAIFFISFLLFLFSSSSLSLFAVFFN